MVGGGKKKEKDKDKPVGKGTLAFKEYLVGDLVIYLTQGREWPSMVSKVESSQLTVNWLYPSSTV